MFWVKRTIIGALACAWLLALGGCTALRLSYNNGAQLAWWWLDGYVDFSREQSPLARQAIDRWFDWHRPSQLRGYAELLVAAQAQVAEPTTAALACGWSDRLREVIAPAINRGLDDFAELVPGLREPQFRHLEQRYAKSDDEMRRDFLQSDSAERQREAVKRTLDRAESLYGRLAEAQKSVISAGVAASPFSPELWLAERQRRQREIVLALRRLVAERADRDQRMATLRALYERTERSSDAAYRAFQARLSEYNCAFAARIHNATTPAQRQSARENIKGWEDDIRSLMAPPPTPPTPQPPG